MNRHLDPLGSGRVFRDRRTGALVVDEDSIGRRGFAGEDPELAGDGGQEYAGEGGQEYAGEGPREFEGEVEDFGARNRYSQRGQYNRYNNYPPQRQSQPYRQPEPAPRQARCASTSGSGPSGCSKPAGSPPRPARPAM